MEVLIIVGTVREGRNTIKVAEPVRDAFSQEGHEVVFYDLKEKDIPYLGTRTYTDDGDPPVDIQNLSSYVREADKVVIVSPEYNHSIPGVLKNALDFLYPEYDGKDFAYVTVSAGGFGGIRALEDLQSFTLTVGANPGPALNVSNVGDHFSEDNVDQEYEGKINDFVKKVENS